MNKHDHTGSAAAGQHGSTRRAYWMFALNLALRLIPMYFAMFTMIDGWRVYRNNMNMFYMALTMLAPMGMIMLATMGPMYGNKPLNLALYPRWPSSLSRLSWRRARRRWWTTSSSSIL
jgi:hypothetical protein